MYGVVILMALSTSAELPDCGRRSCSGCSGCTGVVSSCSGCHGARERCGRRARHGCCGCSGAVIYSGCTGCTGGAVIYPGCTGCAGGAVQMHKADASQPGSSSTVTVLLPSAGQLVIDDYTVPTASDRHIYVASSLNAGETRTITFKATINQQPVTRQVTITAGQDTTVNLATGSVVASR